MQPGNMRLFTGIMLFIKTALRVWGNKGEKIMWQQLFYHWATSLAGIFGAAAAGAATAVVTQGPTKEAAINGAITGAAAGVVAAMGAAAKDPGKV